GRGRSPVPEGSQHEEQREEVSLSRKGLRLPLGRIAGSLAQRESNPPAGRSTEGAESSHPDTLHLLVVELVHFLLLKYRTKELTMKDEILNVVLREDGYHFLEAFHQASEYLQLVFGMDVREVDHTKHTYMLVPTLGLSCDGMVSDGHTMPKTGLLVVVLGVILLEGNCTPEEGIWETLDDMGIYARREHYIYEEPREELLTQVWVQEGYLVYQLVPDSDPARYEFLWGPQAYVETSMFK
ncbi:unnamed protein product, partial [Rangifer tarandus platyrhynchus]